MHPDFYLNQPKSICWYQVSRLVKHSNCKFCWVSLYVLYFCHRKFLNHRIVYLKLWSSWNIQSEDWYTSCDIQNEIIAIMANHVICDLVSDSRGGFFFIICDEYTDISKKEQLTICLWWFDNELEAHKDFFGFYNVPDTASETIVSNIKDVLLRLLLSSVNCYNY